MCCHFLAMMTFKSIAGHCCVLALANTMLLSMT